MVSSPRSVARGQNSTRFALKRMRGTHEKGCIAYQQKPRPTEKQKAPILEGAKCRGSRAPDRKAGEMWHQSTSPKAERRGGVQRDPQIIVVSVEGLNGRG